MKTKRADRVAHLNERLRDIEDEISNFQDEQENLENELFRIKRLPQKDICPSCGGPCLITQCPGCGGPVTVCAICSYGQMENVQDKLESPWACGKVLYEVKNRGYQGWCFGEDEHL